MQAKVLYRGEEIENGFWAETWNVRSTLAEMMYNIGEYTVGNWLKEEPSDDYCEEYLAIDKLNESTDGGYWTIDQGLYLVAYDSELDRAMQGGA